jgi:hypothetical protein
MWLRKERKLISRSFPSNGPNVMSWCPWAVDRAAICLPKNCVRVRASSLLRTGVFSVCSRYQRFWLWYMQPRQAPRYKLQAAVLDLAWSIIQPDGLPDTTQRSERVLRVASCAWIHMSTGAHNRHCLWVATVRRDKGDVLVFSNINGRLFIWTAQLVLRRVDSLII